MDPVGRDRPGITAYGGSVLKLSTATGGTFILPPHSRNTGKMGLLHSSTQLLARQATDASSDKNNNIQCDADDTACEFLNLIASPFASEVRQTQSYAIPCSSLELHANPLPATFRCLPRLPGRISCPQSGCCSPLLPCTTLQQRSLRTESEARRYQTCAAAD